MDPKELNTWLDIATKVVGLIVALIGGLWAYTKFVVERGVLPPTEFTIDCNVVGSQAGKYLVEILLQIKNLGGSPLVVKNLNADLRYLDGKKQINIIADAEKSTFGRVDFPGSVGEDIEVRSKDESKIKEDTNAQGKRASLIKIVKHATFVLPGVEQVYTLVTAVPESATFVLLYAEFEYVQRLSYFQKVVVWLSRRLGLTQFSFKKKNLNKAHTAERVFRLSTDVNKITS